MQRFIRAVLLLGAIIDVIGAALIDWRSTLPVIFKLEFSGLALVIVAGVLFIDYRIRTSSAFARMARSRWFVVGVWITVSLALLAGYLVIRNTLYRLASGG